jgi:hypothetical protein
MSTLYIAEVTKLGIDAQGASIIAPQMPPIAEQTVTIGMSSLPSEPFSGHTRFVQIHTDAMCSIAFSPTPGATPSATTSNQRLGANETRFYAVNPGDLVAVIANT